MWIKDKFGNYINSKWLISLYVGSDGSGGYEVAGNTYLSGDGGGQLSAQFNNGSSMTQTQAQALRDRLGEMLGAFDPAG